MDVLAGDVMWNSWWGCFRPSGQGREGADGAVVEAEDGQELEKGEEQVEVEVEGENEDMEMEIGSLFRTGEETGYETGDELRGVMGSLNALAWNYAPLLYNRRILLQRVLQPNTSGKLKEDQGERNKQ